MQHHTVDNILKGSHTTADSISFSCLSTVVFSVAKSAMSTGLDDWE